MSRITEQDTKQIAFWNKHDSGIDQKNLDKTSLVNCKDALNLYNKLYNNERPSILGFMQSSENVGARIAKKEGLFYMYPRSSIAQDHHTNTTNLTHSRKRNRPATENTVTPELHPFKNHACH